MRVAVAGSPTRSATTTGRPRCRRQLGRRPAAASGAARRRSAARPSRWPAGARPGRASSSQSPPARPGCQLRDQLCPGVAASDRDRRRQPLQHALERAEPAVDDRSLLAAGPSGRCSAAGTAAPSPYENQPCPVLRPSRPAATSSAWAADGVKRGSRPNASHTELRHRRVDVLPDQVGQLERTHPEPARLAQQRVDRGRVGDAFLVRAERLAVERPGHPVHDEARRRRRVHRRLAPGGGEVEDARRNCRVGLPRRRPPRPAGAPVPG